MQEVRNILKLSKFVIFFSALMCIGLGWLMPIKTLLWSSFYPELSVFIGIAALTLLCLPPSPRLTLPVASIFLVSLIPLGQTFIGTLLFAGDGWLNSLYIVGFFLSIVVGFNAGLSDDNSKEFVDGFAVVLIVASVLSAIIAIRQWLGLANSDVELHYSGARAYANLGQPNHLATLLCFGLIALVYLFEKCRLGRTTASLLACVVFFALVITQSRTPFLIGLSVVVFWWWQRRRLSLRLTSACLIGWFCVFIAVYTLFPVLSDALMLPSQSLEARAGASGRFDLWAAAWQAITEGPILGYGWGQIITAQIAVNDQLPVQGLMFYSHNLFLDILLWNGIWVGSLIILGIFVWAFRLLLAPVRLETTFALLIAGAVFAHGMVEYPYGYAYFLLPAGLMLGVAESGRAQGCSFRVSRWVRGMVGLMIVMIVVVAVREFRHYAHNDFNRRIAAAGVIGFEPQELKGGFRIFSQLNALQDFRQIDLIDNLSPADLNDMSHVALRYPYLANLYRYSLALFLNGQLEEGAAQLDILRSIHGEDNYALALEQLDEALKNAGHAGDLFICSLPSGCESVNLKLGER